MIKILSLVLYFLTQANGLPMGPPICTLTPRHSNLQAQKGDWKEHFEVHMFPLNQKRLLDPLNQEFAALPPDGVFFIIQAKVRDLRAFLIFLFMVAARKRGGIGFLIIMKSTALCLTLIKLLLLDKITSA